jgi:signal transduction histidine kinase
VTAGTLIVLAITAVIAWDGEGPSSAFRHLYLVPALWVAGRSGAAAGTVVGFVAGLLYAPLVLPAIESIGLNARTVDGLVALGMPVGVAGVVGRLTDQSRSRARRLATLLAIQKQLGTGAAIEEQLTIVAEQVRRALGARRAAIAIKQDDGCLATFAAPGPATLDARSAAAWTLRTERAVAFSDVGTDPRLGRPTASAPRPERGMLVPLRPGSGCVGVLALEWQGDVAAAIRAAAEEMALHLALGIANARLVLRQRRFAQELEARVAEATERLRAIDHAKSEFLSVVSHELRTPLTALQGFSELLLRRAVPPDRARRFLMHLHTEARRLGRVVADLLDLSRIETGRPEDLRREPLDLVELAERNVELFAAEHPRHRFVVQAREACPILRGDPDAVDRILKNLLSNAVKYSPRGGRITVTAGPAQDDPGMIALVVEDEGVGISPDCLGLVFEKYVRIRHPETSGSRGLGVGLSVVRGLAEAHGGRVEVESRLGEGSRFRVLLPAQEDGRAPPV